LDRCRQHRFEDDESVFPKAFTFGAGKDAGGLSDWDIAVMRKTESTAKAAMLAAVQRLAAVEGRRQDACATADS
jgi:hypothetical protein